MWSAGAGSAPGEKTFFENIKNNIMFIKKSFVQAPLARSVQPRDQGTGLGEGELPGSGGGVVCGPCSQPGKQGRQAARQMTSVVRYLLFIYLFIY